MERSDKAEMFEKKKKEKKKGKKSGRVRDKGNRWITPQTSGLIGLELKDEPPVVGFFIVDPGHKAQRGFLPFVHLAFQNN